MFFNVVMCKYRLRVDPRYFRSTRVETLLGDSSKAWLGWEPRITFEEMVGEMVHEDFAPASVEKTCRDEGFHIFDSKEV